MRYLILSDIHANWEALEAVAEHARGKYDRVLCCGDLIGYGADPNAVTEWARANVNGVVRGNHDKASVGLDDLEWFNPVARAAAVWTHHELTSENAEYVRSLPQGPLALLGFQVVHGSPLDEDEYVIDAADAFMTFSYLEMPLTFFGHTHLQGGFIWNHARVETIEKTPMTEERLTLELDDRCVYLINPGSVGQPRDADPRAAYVIYNPEERFLIFYRLPYDVAKAQEKIRQAGLPPLLADRLAAGR
ncbi:MAG TPA: metallophosphoesterase family protein [Bryobacteraceae bacterium]|nr:metallophosphoesterase family protein [Bryobacteraceae bacterium]